MINVYLIDENRVFTGEVIQQEEKDKIKGIITNPIEYNSETECIVWNGFNWMIKPLSFKLDFELQHLKSVASGKLQANYRNALVTGYTDSITGIKLSGDEITFNELQKLSHRVNNKKGAGNIEGHTQSFFDMLGVAQSLPGQECIELLDRYGDWWEGLYLLNKIKYGQIQSATTETELNEIDLNSLDLEF
jgi:hypothetical protein